MMDRRGKIWSPRLLVPVVVALQVGVFWLAMQVSQRRPGENLPEVPDRAPAFPNALPDDSAVVLAEPGPDWLPPLSDPARALLTCYEPLPAAEPEAAAPGPELVGPMLPADLKALGAALSEESAGVEVALSPAYAGPIVPPEEILGPAASVPDVPRPVEESAIASQPRIIHPQEAYPIAGPAGQSVEGPSQPFHSPGERRVARSLPLERIARQADAHSRSAFDLAGRGAQFAARSEFIMALRLVAQGLDTEEQTNAHSEALGQGLQALREAEDFLPRGSRLEADLDMAGIVVGHRTPVLKDLSLDGLTSLSAFQRYHTFAQEQLATAAGREVAGSIALEGLGKLYAAMAAQSVASVKAADSKAVVFYQAAILACPQNYMASNDLGVLLARAGFYDDARVALTHSLSIHPQTSGWRNLAIVYRELGQMDLAMRAATRWQVARRAELAAGAARKEGGAPAVEWMPPEAFAQTYASRADEPRGQTAPAAPAVEPAADRPVSRQAGGRWWPPGASNFPK